MITHDKHLFFIHIPKNAGRSISELFNQRFDHYTAHYYRIEYAHYWKQYDRFTIVRNPYDRFVSMYHYLSAHRRHATEPICDQLPTFKEWLCANIFAFAGEFSITSPEGQRGTDYLLGSPYWFSPQCRFIEDAYGNINDIAIFKYEQLPAIIPYLHQKEVPVSHIPHLNATKHAPYLSYYDSELLTLLSRFNPLVRDCTTLNYDILI